MRLEENGKWCYSRFGEVFNSNLFDTKEQAIEAGKADLEEETVWVGQAYKYSVDEEHFNGRDVLEDLSCQAGDECGEAAEDWLIGVPQKNVDELSDRLNKVLLDWLKENGEVPGFFRVDNIEKIVPNPLSPKG